MKIDAMAKREDFYAINEHTLQKYYHEVRGNSVEITTKSYYETSNVFVYPKINAIVTKSPDKSVKKYIYDEFNNRKSRTKRMISKTYVVLALKSRGLMAEKALYFSKPEVVSSSTLIWPCNRKIRVFEFKEGYVDSIVKEGFTKKYFENETTFRRKGEYEFVPKIIASGEYWYREAILPGQPLARVRSKALFEKSCRAVIDNLKDINRTTLKYEDAIRYVGDLHSSIEAKLKVAALKKNVKKIGDIRAVVANAAEEASRIDRQIPLVLSHGDLQEGNIWVDVKNAHPYIIDWETNGFRSIWYDPATLLLGTRTNNGVVNMMESVSGPVGTAAILSNDQIKNNDMRKIACVILLEDIVFYLDDMLELPYDFGSDIFNAFGRQILCLTQSWRRS